jgi:nitroimidazol reductase NimA-like FMN-containing flavoprotein (pyridoxamine 5'-phosphate oxidase superfamily)
MNLRAGLSDLAVLTHDDCVHRLLRGCVGRVGFVHDERPEVLPVNYAADADGRVVFRAGPNSVLRGVVGQPVVFEVDGADASRRSGWSVCVHGSGLEITDADDPLASQLRKLPVITWAPGRRDRWFAVVPAAVTGRELPISVTGDEGWFPGVPAS